MITVDELKAMPLDEPIGEAVICDIERMANEGLQPFYQREFEPYEGVYRVNDFAKYVSEDSWRTFCTLSRDAGVPDRDIMAAGGWNSPQMLDYYDMARRGLDGRAGDGLQRFLNNG